MSRANIAVNKPQAMQLRESTNDGLKNPQTRNQPLAAEIGGLRNLKNRRMILGLSEWHSLIT